MGFSRQEHCSGFPLPSPGDLPDSGIEPMDPESVGILYHCTTWETLAHDDDEAEKQEKPTWDRPQYFWDTFP